MSKEFLTEPGPKSPTNHRSCPSHCCPVHGCKYGYVTCPVVRRQVPPEFSDNNGCEHCENEQTRSENIESRVKARLLGLAGSWRDQAAVRKSCAPDQVEYENGRDDQREFCAGELEDAIRAVFDD